MHTRLLINPVNFDYDTLLLINFESLNFLNKIQMFERLNQIILRVNLLDLLIIYRNYILVLEVVKLQSLTRSGMATAKNCCFNFSCSYP